MPREFEAIRPLSDNELGALIDASEKDTAQRQMVVKSAMFAGMYATEISHLRDGWIRDNPKRIIIPKEARCQPAGSDRDFDVCNHCRTSGETDKWRPKRPDKHHRTIPVWNDDFARLLDYWFERNATVCHPTHVTETIQRVARNADGIDENDVDTTTLRHTAGVLFARHGIEPDDIRDVMGYRELREHNDRAHMFHRYADTFDD